MFQIVIISIAIVEFLLYKKSKNIYPFKISAIYYSLSIFYSLIFDLVAKPGFSLLFSKLDKISIYNFDSLGVAHSIVLFLAIDFFYYVSHWLSHQVRFFWMTHETHHLPTELTTLSGTAHSLSGMFFRPFFIFSFSLVFFGYKIELILLYYAINSIYQNMIHTRFTDHVPYFDKIFNTPRLHRIHHAAELNRNGKNLGGILILFDRLFGTYENSADINSNTIVFGISENRKTQTYLNTILAEAACVKKTFISYVGKSNSLK